VWLRSLTSVDISKCSTDQNTFFWGGGVILITGSFYEKVPQCNNAVEPTVFLCYMLEVSCSDLGSELDYYTCVRDLFQSSDKLPRNTSVSTKTLPSTFLPIHYSLTGLSFVAVYTHLKKVMWSRYRSGVAQRVGRGIALLFHDHGTRRGWVVSSTPWPHFTPGKHPVPILQEAVWAPGPVWTGGKSRPNRDSIPHSPARSQSLYGLSYRAPHYMHVYIYKIAKCPYINLKSIWKWELTIS